MNQLATGGRGVEDKSPYITDRTKRRKWDELKKANLISQTMLDVVSQGRICIALCLLSCLPLKLSCENECLVPTPTGTKPERKTATTCGGEPHQHLHTS